MCWSWVTHFLFCVQMSNNLILFSPRTVSICINPRSILGCFTCDVSLKPGQWFHKKCSLIIRNSTTIVRLYSWSTVTNKTDQLCTTATDYKMQLLRWPNFQLIDLSQLTYISNASSSKEKDTWYIIWPSQENWIYYLIFYQSYSKFN